MQGSLLAVLVLSVLLAALARRFNASAPLALVVAGLAMSAIPGFKDIELVRSGALGYVTARRSGRQKPHSDALGSSSQGTAR